MKLSLRVEKNPGYPGTEDGPGRGATLSEAGTWTLLGVPGVSVPDDPELIICPQTLPAGTRAFHIVPPTFGSSLIRVKLLTQHWRPV